MTSVSNDHADRYDSYNDEILNRWKPSHPFRSDKQSRLPSYGGAISRYPSKDRRRSSALTNSMSGSSRADSPSKNYIGGRFVDRYSRNSPESKEGIKSEDRPYHFADSTYLDSDRSFDQSRDDDPEQETHSHYTAERFHNEEEDAEPEDEDDNEDEADEDDSKSTANNSRVEEADIHRSPEVKQAFSVEPKYREGFFQPSKATTETKPEAKITIDPQYVDYPNGCNYPMTKLESEFSELEKEYKQRKPNQASLGVKQTNNLVPDVKAYALYKENLSNFSLTLNDRINLIKKRNLLIKKKRLSLWMEYEKTRKSNDLKRKDLEEQLRVIHPADDEIKRELSAIDIRVKQSNSNSSANMPAVEVPSQPSRRGRRHGDSVTTEAEFQEILKSLENEQDEEPMAKAKRVSAVIPDLILDPVEKTSSNFMDSNNIVDDKDAWALRIRYDFIDNFSEEEHDLFCEAFCRSPKRFGEIARYMGGFRTAEECVAHYYMTKKAMSYKFLVSQYKKKTSKKSSRRKSSKAKAPVTPTATEIPEDARPEFSNEVHAEEQIESMQEDAADLKRRNTNLSNSEIDSEEPAKKKSRSIGEWSDPTPSITDKLEALEVTVPDRPIDNRIEIKQSGGVTQPDMTEDQTSVEEHSGRPESPPIHAVLGLNTEPPEVPDQKRQNSSYWSITDVNEFPYLLSTYGSKWSSIADHFPTKTATMVRNYFQRNSEKNGWSDIVATADQRLAQGSKGEDGDLNSIDTTIVVKPQKNAVLEHSIDGAQAYDAASGNRAREDDKISHVDSLETSKSPSNLAGVSTPNPGSLEANGENSTSHQYPATPKSKREDAAQAAPVRPEGQKPSIMSLLNSDATPFKPLVPVPGLVTSKPNNLSSLLNAQSSPSAPVREAQMPDRRNSVKSLLQD